MPKLKVLVVDDSQLIRQLLTEILSGDHRIEVVGAAVDPYEARQMIKDLNPDVITLDVEMPKMDGVTFLKNLMRLRPMPVVMISTLTAEGSNTTMRALELGAIDFIEKPSNLGAVMEDYRAIIVEKVLAAGSVDKRKLEEFQQRLIRQANTAPAPIAKPRIAKPTQHLPADKVMVIGGSTGSLEALKTLLENIQFTGKESILVALHLPGKFTASYAARLNDNLPIEVKEAEHGEPVKQGYVYIAPGGRHLEVKKRGAGFSNVISDGERVNLHKPSVDVLFDSAVSANEKKIEGMILTGMGNDGAAGLLRMSQAGLKTYAQDEASSVVWGMPGSAHKMGAVTDSNLLNLEQLAKKAQQFFK